MKYDFLLRADKGTQKKQDIKITGASTLAGDEVDRMVKDAEQYADEDKKRREAVDTKNQVCHPGSDFSRNVLVKAETAVVEFAPDRRSQNFPQGICCNCFWLQIFLQILVPLYLCRSYCDR